MRWPFRKKKPVMAEGETSRRDAMADAVDASVQAADDERYTQMKRIDADLKQRLDLLRRDAELVTRKRD